MKWQGLMKNKQFGTVNSLCAYSSPSSLGCLEPLKKSIWYDLDPRDYRKIVNAPKLP